MLIVCPPLLPSADIDDCPGSSTEQRCCVTATWAGARRGHCPCRGGRLRCYITEDSAGRACPRPHVGGGGGAGSSSPNGAAPAGGDSGAAAEEEDDDEAAEPAGMAAPMEQHDTSAVDDDEESVDPASSLMVGGAATSSCAAKGPTQQQPRRPPWYCQEQHINERREMVRVRPHKSTRAQCTHASC